MKRLTWETIILIIEEMYDINQAEIGKYLGVHKSTITRLIKGTKQFSLTNEDVYNRLFSPENGPLRESERFLFELLKEAIFKVIKTVIMRELWIKEYETGDYKAFVLRMLALRKNRSKNDDSALDLMFHLYPEAYMQRLRNPLWKIKDDE